MGLTNAERQARWRERQKQKLAEAQASASELVPIESLLDRMNAAFEEAHVAEVLRCVAVADERDGEPVRGSPWEIRRRALLMHPGFEPLTEEQWIEKARAAGEAQAFHIALSLRRDALTEDIQRLEKEQPAQAKASKRKRSGSR